MTKIISISKEIASFNIAKELLLFEMQKAIMWSRERQKIYDNNCKIFEDVSGQEWDRERSEYYFKKFTDDTYTRDLFYIMIAFKVYGIKELEYTNISIPKDLILEILDADLKKEFNNDIKSMSIDSRFISKLIMVLKNIKKIFHKDRIIFWRFEDIGNCFDLCNPSLPNLELSRDILEIKKVETTKECYILI